MVLPRYIGLLNHLRWYSIFLGSPSDYPPGKHFVNNTAHQIKTTGKIHNLDDVSEDTPPRTPEQAESIDG